MQNKEYYLLDFSFTPPLAIECGSGEECQKMLTEVAKIDGYYNYKIVTKAVYESLKGGG